MRVPDAWLPGIEELGGDPQVFYRAMLHPVHHRKDERIRAHVLLGFLALLFIRVAEIHVKDTQRNIRRELQRIHRGHFEDSAGRLQQYTEPPPLSARS